MSVRSNSAQHFEGYVEGIAYLTPSDTVLQRPQRLHNQPHKHELALCHDVILVAHPWDPAGRPQYTGAHHGGEAGGGSPTPLRNHNNTCIWQELDGQICFGR